MSEKAKILFHDVLSHISEILGLESTVTSNWGELVNCYIHEDIDTSPHEVVKPPFESFSFSSLEFDFGTFADNGNWVWHLNMYKPRSLGKWLPICPFIRCFCQYNPGSVCPVILFSPEGAKLLPFRDLLFRIFSFRN
jgi:hypothetical protein